MIKYLLILMICVCAYQQSFAGNFSNLDNLCFSKADGEYPSTNQNNKLILPHINKRITKTEGYVKYNGFIYMTANTFTDNYRFLGSYLLRYDCLSHSTARLSGLLKKNIAGELGHLRYSSNANAMMIFHLGSSANAAWIYDLETSEIKSINTRLISQGKKVSWNIILDSYSGDSVQIEKLYYDSMNRITNYGNPDIMMYIF